MGAEHPAFGILGRWHRLTGTPAWSLLVQGVIAITLILAFGSFVDTILYTAPAVYAFYLASSLSVIVLRKKEPDVERPYRVTGYPFTPVIFSAVCAILIYSAVAYAAVNKPVSLVVLLATLLAGLLVYRLERFFSPANLR